MNGDKLGYYATLKIQTNASQQEIKAAYKARAKELHPDINPDPQAHTKFQNVQEAYSVLRDPTNRAKYDVGSFSGFGSQPTQAASSSQKENIEPIKCSVCGVISAQPRYVIYWHIISIIFLSFKNPKQGIFCHKCGENTAIKESLITWFMGWWGFPWGPIWSIGAIYKNLFGGERPTDLNARILLHQAAYFAENGQPELAYAVFSEAKQLASKCGLFEEFSQHDSFFWVSTKKQTLGNKWRQFTPKRWLQLSPIIAIVLLIFFEL